MRSATKSHSLLKEIDVKRSWQEGNGSQFITTKVKVFRHVEAHKELHFHSLKYSFSFSLQDNRGVLTGACQWISLFQCHPRQPWGPRLLWCHRERLQKTKERLEFERERGTRTTQHTMLIETTCSKWAVAPSLHEILARFSTKGPTNQLDNGPTAHGVCRKQATPTQDCSCMCLGVPAFRLGPLSTRHSTNQEEKAHRLNTTIRLWGPSYAWDWIKERMLLHCTLANVGLRIFHVHICTWYFQHWTERI